MSAMFVRGVRPRRALVFAASAALFVIAQKPRIGWATPSVWVIDDGEKIRRDATSITLESEVESSVWRPGGAVRLFAMRNESIGLQVVVHADDRVLDSVTVDLDELACREGPRLVATPLAREDAGRVVGRPIERYVEHFVDVHRASGGRTAGESLGWERGSGPDPRAWTGEIPDALIPVELAPPWAPYPMHVAPRTNGVVWIDVNVAPDQAAGAYRGTIEVQSGRVPLASIPIELDVADVRLPDHPGGAVVYYDPDELARRVGPGAEEHLWKVLHAHRIAPLHDAVGPDDVRRQAEALDGSLYTRARGYLGPAPDAGDGILSIGAYGSLGDPDDQRQERVKQIADAVAAADLFDHAIVFLYAMDENCDSPRASQWKERLRDSSDRNLRRVRVGWTCSRDPASQPVDIAIVDATYVPARAKAAELRGKTVWVYNGSLPRTGTFLLDSDAISPRVNGWLAAIEAVPQWFYWESTYWYDRHGRVPVDPFANAESFHNDDGDWADGDGLLLYPGRQRDFFQRHSLGFDGVVPSIRLKNWRRGIEDAGYLQLARARNPERADAVARALIPLAFDAAHPGKPPAWSPRGEPFFEARRALFRIATSPAGTSPGDAPDPTSRTYAAPRANARRWAQASAGAVLAVLSVVAFAVGRRRRRRTAPATTSAVLSEPQRSSAAAVRDRSSSTH